MSHSMRKATRYPVREQERVKSGNGYGLPMRDRPLKEQARPSRSSDPYENDRAFKTALHYFKKGRLDVARNLVDKLLVAYPGNRNLEKFKKIIVQRTPKDDLAYRDHPSYFTLRSHLERKDWVAALSSANSLLASHPDVRAVKDVQRKLYRRVKKREARTRFLLLGGLVFAAFLLISVAGIVYSYFSSPAPLSEILLPQSALEIPPHYLFSIHDANQPVGVGLSPDGERIYVTEMGGARSVRIFDRTGGSLGSFVSPKTEVGERAPVYVAADNQGRVYVSDRMQHAIFIYSQDGDYIDALLGPDLSLSEYVGQHTDRRQKAGELQTNLPGDPSPDGSSADDGPANAIAARPLWSPLGVRVSQGDQLLLTDVSRSRHRVVEISLSGQPTAREWSTFEPQTSQYGTSGKGNGQLQFPNSAVADSKGRVYVADGNNRRIAVWDSEGHFQFNFGNGIGPGSLSLPRGLFIDWRDRLYIVDTVAQNVKVFDVSASTPTFLFEFGDFGQGDGLFNYPNDIAVDGTGRLYITDRENNRIQVWSY